MEEIIEPAEGLPKRSPAIKINLQSRVTLLLGVIMLIIDLLGGYFGHPLVIGTNE